MIRKKSANEIVSRAAQYLERESPITLVSPGSTVRALLDSVSTEIAALYNTIDRAMLQAFVSSSSGVFLDLLSEIVGLSRRTEVAAITSANDRNIRFYVSTGVLSDYVTTIPAGTTVTNADGLVIYVVDNTVAVPTGSTEVFVTARAQTVGIAGNVGVGILTTHNLGSAVVLVTNREAITTASSIETDESLRFRIRNAVRSAEGANAVSIRTAALAVGGVADAVMREFAMGAGSFELLLIPVGNRVPATVIQQVVSNVNATIAYGMNFTVREPRYVPFSIDVELVMPRTDDIDKPLMKETAASNIQRYVGQLRPSATMSMGRIREACLSVNRDIVDVHIRNMRINGRTQHVSDYHLADDEVFIPDPAEASPFQVV